MLRALSLLALALALTLAPAADARAAWLRPVRGPVLARFDYTRARAFAAGGRRGVDFAAAPGSPVRAPCSGRVTFAGAVPGWAGAVSVRCGALVATLLRLGATGVRARDAVAAGDVVGRAGPLGRVRLGARRAGERLAYLDPLLLLRGERRSPPLEPLGPAPRDVQPRPRPRLRAAPLERRAWRSPAAAAPHGAPLIAWLGAALLAVSLAGGGAAGRVRRRRRRRAVARAAALP